MVLQTTFAVFPLLLLLSPLIHPSSSSSLVSHYDLDWGSLRQPGLPRYSPRSSDAPTYKKRESSSSSSSNSTITLEFTCTDPTDDTTTVLTSPLPFASYLPPSTASTCTRAHASFLRAITRIANIVHLRHSIHVKASFASFCEQQTSSLSTAREKCRAEQGVLGSAGPAAWHEWNETTAEMLGTDHSYLYPSALARQYAPHAMQYQDYDIAASFNSEPLWYFATSDSDDSDWDANHQWHLQWSAKPNPPLKLRAVVYDFEQIVLHELLHGLGFISSWYPWLDNTSILPAAPLVLTDGTIVGLTKPWLFNKWMAHVPTRTWMRQYQQQILTTSADIANGIFNGSLIFPFNTWTAAFKNTPAYTTALYLYTHAAINPGAVATYFPKLLPPPYHRTTSPLALHYAILYTPPEYSAGSTFSHLDSNTYRGTKQFLMRPFGTSGFGLDGMTPRGEPLGELVQGILGALGYATSMFHVPG
ncbi:hypothetical protein PhCBS80983_g05081 [Powellomyces hirtus]|uniref:Uncharacterized protein n=1 Tax=Powellomyces hirtus TaxID=109895 RepID=A0A507DXM3_9FUNG|nr:hypothetical protein PhCBS80983_g05081 [Powellomyces hirtus]